MINGLLMITVQESRKELKHLIQIIQDPDIVIHLPDRMVEHIVITTVGSRLPISRQYQLNRTRKPSLVKPTKSISLLMRSSRVSVLSREILIQKMHLIGLQLTNHLLILSIDQKIVKVTQLQSKDKVLRIMIIQEMLHGEHRTAK